MYLCPITRTRLISATAGGGKLFYSKASGGRLVTYSMMRSFIGENAAREIYMRSKSPKTSVEGLSCPSCSRAMRKIRAPRWTGAYDVEVCSSCQVFWLDKDHHPEIPSAEDMTSENGDSSYVSEVIDDYSRVMIIEESKRVEAKFSGPDDLKSKIAGLIGLPVEIHNRLDPFGWIGKAFALIMVIIFFLQKYYEQEVFSYLGFYPEKSLIENGIAIWTAAFIHSGPIHLLINLYFFLVFANDVEDFLGPIKYVIFIFLVILMNSFIQTFLSTSVDIPHVGFSGVVSSLMIFYALQFRKTKIGYASPLLVYSQIFRSHTRVYRTIEPNWYRVHIWWALGFWILIEVVLYYFVERNGYSRVSHSGHLSGYITGSILWVVWGKWEKKVDKEIKPILDLENGEFKRD